MTVKITERPNAWFSRHAKNNRPAVRLYCFPYAGGSPSIFRDWSSRLPDVVELMPVHLPGRADRFREAATYDFDHLLAEIHAAMPPTDLPVVLFGHSMGAFLAYELAVHLQEEGDPPDMLIVAAARPPHWPPDQTLVDEGRLIEELRRERPDSMSLHDEELIEIMLPTIKADMTLGDRYHRSDPVALACPVVSYVGTDDGEKPLETAAAWRRCAREVFGVAVFPGGHYFIDDSPSPVFDRLSTDLRAVAGEVRGT